MDYAPFSCNTRSFKLEVLAALGAVVNDGTNTLKFCMTNINLPLRLEKELGCIEELPEITEIAQ